jgi:UDP-glucuronate decarboxylase
MNSRVGLTGPINLGNPAEYTMIELAEEILRQVGGSSKLVYRELPADDPKKRRPNIELAKRELNWQPTVTLEDGIKETVSHFRRLLAKS